MQVRQVCEPGKMEVHPLMLVQPPGTQLYPILQLRQYVIPVTCTQVMELGTRSEQRRQELLTKM